MGDLRATGWRAREGVRSVFFVMALLTFTLVQQQNLFTGFQFALVLPLALFAVSVRTALARNPAQGFLGTMLLNSAATLTLASGVVAWPLTLPVLLRVHGVGKPVRKWWLIWTLFFAANAASCLGSRHGSGPPLQTALPWSAGLVVQYFLTYLGAPFVHGIGPDSEVVACLLGFVLAGCFALVTAGVWRFRQRPGLLDRALPWMALGGFSLANAALTTLGRARFGAGQAMESRYAPYAVLLVVALLPLVVLLRRELRGALRPGRFAAGPIFHGFIGGLLLLQAMGTWRQIQVWPAVRHDRLLFRAVVQTANCVDVPALVTRLTPSAAAFRSTVNALDRLGFVRPKLLHSNDIAEVGDPRSAGDVAFGEMRAIAGAGEGRLAVGGWAVLPDRMEAADAVLLTYDSPAGVPTIFALVAVTGERREAVAATGEPGLLVSGWQWNFSADHIPTGAGPIKAWAYDATTAQAWRLAGSVPSH